MLSLTSFPPALAALPNWLCWRLEPDARSGRPAKVPCNPHTGRRASATNPASWGTLAQALACAEKYQYTGVGFVFTKEIGYVGLDIDRCLTNGRPSDIAVVERAESFRNPCISEIHACFFWIQVL